MQDMALKKMKAKEEERKKLMDVKVTLDEEENEEDMLDDVDYDEEAKKDGEKRRFGSVETKKVFTA